DDRHIGRLKRCRRVQQVTNTRRLQPGLLNDGADLVKGRELDLGVRTIEARPSITDAETRRPQMVLVRPHVDGASWKLESQLTTGFGRVKAGDCQVDFTTRVLLGEVAVHVLAARTCVQPRMTCA